jgi:EmrB/QacA subfamily drug resistance transporter
MAYLTINLMQLKENRGMRNLSLVLIIIGFGTFMSAMSNSIINIGLPFIKDEFNSAIEDVEWVLLSINLTSSIMLLPMGRLGDIISYRRIYFTGFLIMSLGAEAAALSPDLMLLISARIIQGIGASMIMASAPAILTTTFPAEKRGRTLGFQATMTYLGLTIGPTIGGYIIYLADWRWTFHFQVPIGIVTAVIAWRFLPGEREIRKEKGYDFSGSLFFFGLMTSFLLFLSHWESWGFESIKTLSLIFLSAVFLSLFLFNEKRSRNPLLDLQMFRNRTFACSTGCAFLNYIALFHVTFLIPFYLKNELNLNPRTMGNILSVMPLSMTLVALFSGYVSDLIGSRMLSAGGMLISGAGMLLFAFDIRGISLVELSFYLGVTGIGIGIFISPNSNSLMGSAPRERQGTAAGVLATARNTGMMVGIAISGSVYTMMSRHFASENPSSGNFSIEAMKTAVIIGAVISISGALLALIGKNDTKSIS